MDSIRVATWNVSWTGRGSRHFDQSQRRIAEIEADILVLTETTPDLVPAEGFVAKGRTRLGLLRQSGAPQGPPLVTLAGHRCL